MSALTRRHLGAGFAALTALGTIPSALAEGRASAPGTPLDPRPQTYALLNQAAPMFDFPGPHGERRRLQDYRGQVLILCFWGLWCPDSVADGANAHRLAQAAERHNGVAFLGVHTRGRFGRWGGVLRYFEETGFSFPVAFDEGRDFARDIYRIAWFPTYLAIDRAGVIRAWRTDLETQGAQAFLAQTRPLWT
ncbi:MAG: TlpA family protein disulfide reductase [Alphaproteobacteria bacterium]|jgi:hypothetical protein|nr:TlpA family protein disulfide reductase [Alphaproteobacteria bacterium]